MEIKHKLTGETLINIYRATLRGAHHPLACVVVKAIN